MAKATLNNCLILCVDSCFGSLSVSSILVTDPLVSTGRDYLEEEEASFSPDHECCAQTNSRHFLSPVQTPVHSSRQTYFKAFYLAPSFLTSLSLPSIRIRFPVTAQFLFQQPFQRHPAQVWITNPLDSGQRAPSPVVMLCSDFGEGAWMPASES